MPHELPKAYEPGAIETRWAEYWIKEKLFHVETPAASPQGLKPPSNERLDGTAKAVPFPHISSGQECPSHVPFCLRLLLQGAWLCRIPPTLSGSRR